MQVSPAFHCDALPCGREPSKLLDRDFFPMFSDLTSFFICLRLFLFCFIFEPGVLNPLSHAFFSQVDII